MKEGLIGSATRRAATGAMPIVSLNRASNPDRDTELLEACLALQEKLPSLTGDEHPYFAVRLNYVVIIGQTNPGVRSAVLAYDVTHPVGKSARRILRKLAYRV